MRSLGGIISEQVQEALAEDNIDDISARLIGSFMVACVHKFKARVGKAQKALLDYENILGASSTFGKKKPMSSRLQVWAGLNNDEILASFFEELHQASDSTIEALRANRARSASLSMKACIIGNMPRDFLPAFIIANYLNSVLGAGDSLLQYPNLRGRIPKLGAYYGAMLTVRNLMQRQELYNIRKQVHFHEVSIPSLLLAIVKNLTTVDR